MDIIVSHITALEVLRRWDSFKLVEASEAVQNPILPDRMPTAREIKASLEQLRPLSGATLPLHVLVASTAGRHPSPKAVAHLAQRDLPRRLVLLTCPGRLLLVPRARRAADGRVRERPRASHAR